MLIWSYSYIKEEEEELQAACLSEWDSRVGATV